MVVDFSKYLASSSLSSHVFELDAAEILDDRTSYERMINVNLPVLR